MPFFNLTARNVVLQASDHDEEDTLEAYPSKDLKRKLESPRAYALTAPPSRGGACSNSLIIVSATAFFLACLVLWQRLPNTACTSAIPIHHVVPKIVTARDMADPWGDPLSTKVAIPGIEDADTELQSTMSSKPRVALCFFGLTRSLAYTEESIQEHIVRPLTNAGYEVDIFMHTYYDVEKLKNVRSHENAALNLTEWRLLSPTAITMTAQATFLQRHQYAIDACLARGSAWPKMDDHRANVKNMMCQLNSLKEVGRLVHQKMEAQPWMDYKAVMFARPDVLYNCDFPAEIIEDVTEDTVHIPNWGDFKGMNDRFALMSPKRALTWSGRLKFALSECRTEPIHSELYAKLFAERAQFDVKRVENFAFYRVRSNGALSLRDVQDLTACDADALSHYEAQ